MRRNVVLAEISEAIVDCEHKTAPESAAGMEFGFSVGTPNLRNGRILLSDAKRVDRRTYDAWPVRMAPEEGDLILAREAPVGQVGRVAAGQKICLGQRTVLIRPDSSLVSSRFLHYLLLSPPVQDAMQAKAAGSTVPHLNVADIRDLPLPELPPRGQQDRIGLLLGALDDKIAVNERIAATIEGLLRCRFQEICERATDSVAIGDLALAANSHTDPSRLETNVPYIGLEHMPRRSIWLTEHGESDTVASIKNSFEAGDVLFGKLRPYFHKVGLATCAGVCSTDIIVIRAKESRYRNWLLMALSSDEVVSHATSCSEGTRMPRVKWSDLASYRIPLANPRTVEAFDRYAERLIGRAGAAFAENRTLAELRDALLPSLISGEIRVRSAQTLVSDAV